MCTQMQVQHADAYSVTGNRTRRTMLPTASRLLWERHTLLLRPDTLSAWAMLGYVRKT